MLSERLHRLIYKNDHAPSNERTKEASISKMKDKVSDKDLEVADPTAARDDKVVREETTSKPASFGSVHTEEDENHGQHKTTPWKSLGIMLVENKRVLTVAMIGVIIAAIVVAIAVPLTSGNRSGSRPQSLPLTELNTTEGRRMIDLIHAYLPNRAFDDATSSQVKALKWSLDDTFFVEHNITDSQTPSTTNTIEERKLQRYALAAVWIAGDATESEGIGRGTWLEPTSECEWSSEDGYGYVDCCEWSSEYGYRDCYSDTFDLILGGSFTGTLPPEVGLLTNMRMLEVVQQIEGFSLRGTIPSEIGLLTTAENLIIYGQPEYNKGVKIGGTVPTEIGLMTSLTSLTLHGSLLEGSIPTELGDLVRLTSLGITGNKRLNGPLPTQIGRLTSLDGLVLENNSLSGTIPTEIGRLTKLNYWRIHDNDMKGPIPTEMAKVEQLSMFVAHSNQFTGALPVELGDMNELRRLDVHHNLIEGTIPVGWKGFEGLAGMDLSDNKLEGSIPSVFVSFSRLANLNLSKNNLVGTIPSEFGMMTQLEELLLHDNHLSGTVPDGLADAPYLSVLGIHKNDIEGTISDGLCRHSDFYTEDRMSLIFVDCDKVTCPPVVDCWCIDGNKEEDKLSSVHLDHWYWHDDSLDEPDLAMCSD